MKKKTLDRFKEFLTARGAEVLVPTNEYEVIRFRTPLGTSIIYTGKRGFSYTGEAKKAFQSFSSQGVPWTAGTRETNGLKSHRRSVKSRTIRERDGDNCFYCGKPVSDEDESIEHLLSLIHGGNNHISNLVLAHLKCNVKVGHYPIIAKIKMREHTLGLSVASTQEA